MTPTLAAQPPTMCAPVIVVVTGRQHICPAHKLGDPAHVVILDTLDIGGSSVGCQQVSLFELIYQILIDFYNDSLNIIQTHDFRQNPRTKLNNVLIISRDPFTTQKLI